MRSRDRLRSAWRQAALAALAITATLVASPSGVAAQTDDAGQVKTSKGTVRIERAGARLPAAVGARVRPGDVVITGADGTVGITFVDSSLLSTGPNSVLVIDRFAFDKTTHSGSFETSLRQGTLAAVSGKIAKQSPDAMKVRTPAAVLGARGTEFLARASEPPK